MSTFEFELTRTELQAHLNERVAAHAKRAEALEAKAEKIRESGTLSDADLKILERSPMGSVYGGIGALAGMPQRSQLIEQVLKQFASRIKANKQKARELDFYATHLPAGMTSFLLTAFDLAAFEFFGVNVIGPLPYSQLNDEEDPEDSIGSIGTPEDVIRAQASGLHGLG